MRKFSISICALFLVVDFNACTIMHFAPPPATTELARTGAGQHFDLATLREGRSLFVSRCIECHTLPVASRYTESDWPCIVHEMGGRANLKPVERDAVLTYILAIRAHPSSR